MPTIANNVRFRLVAHKNTGLKNAPKILDKNLRGGLEAVGKTLINAAQRRMRKDTGQTQKSLQQAIKVVNGRYSLEVFSQLIQAFVDAYGLHRGVFAPWQQGTRIFEWAKRREKRPEIFTAKGRTPQGPARPKQGIAFRTRHRKVQKVGGKQTNRRVSERFRRQEAQTKRVAFLIARAIYRRGLKGSKWNVAALEANKRNIINQLQNALYRAANEINRA